MANKEGEERYTVYYPNPKNKKEWIKVYDNAKKEYLTIEDALARILNILDKAR